MSSTTQPSATERASATPYVPRILLRHLQEDPESQWWTTEGSVVFVDISGFTKLSEKLAKIGKEGAEQVTDAIETCFTDLLAVAYANDGSLIKFGGDALLLLFEDDDHVANACRSAVWMRRALRDVGRIEIPGGSHLQLRMSVGVHTGTYHFFHVGGSHRELVVTGSGWTGTVAMEHVADAGEILLSPEIAAKLPPRCIGEPKGPGFLLKREPPGHHAASKIPTYDVDPDAVAHCLSTAVRSHVLAGGGTPEHRQISIAFIHYDGTDDMIEEFGPSKVAADLQELLADTQAACDEFGVCFLSTDADDNGGKLILTAGAPTITGNDEERMLLALRKIADKERAIPIRIGVNKGGVFAGDIGPWYRRTYTVMGDAVNLAARLMAKATAGQIFATADVLDASGTRFAVIELEPFMVKGKAKPVQAWAVGEVLGARTRDASVQLPLIGRDKELAELREALAEAREGRGSLVEIVGEPGIGKTRLIEELHPAQEARVLSASAEAFTSSTPYVIWRELLREMLGVGWEADDRSVVRQLQEIIAARDPSLVPWLPLVAIPLDVDMPLTDEVEQLAEEFRQSKLHEVVGRFLAVALEGETLIHVEDAHLMDGASGDLLTYLVRDIGARPWLCTITRRDIESGYHAPTEERSRSIRLEPLERDDVVALIEAATEDAPLLPHDVSLVADRAGGNPQFALDLVQVITSGAMLPESIETAAMARIDALAPADRALVRRASVLGLSFARRFLTEVLDEEAPSPDVETWERLGEFFLDEGDDYIRFRRAVVRDAAYTGLPFRTRRELHARVADRFEREFNPEESGGILSLHHFLAGNYEKAWRYARMAGKRAGEQFAHQESAQLSQRAIDAARRLPDADPTEVAAAYEAMGDEFHQANQFQRAADAFVAARRLFAGRPLDEARVLLARSKVESTMGGTSGSLRWASRARSKIADLTDPEALRLRAQIDAWYATVLQGAGRIKEALRWCEVVLEDDVPQACAQAYYVLGVADFMDGRSAEENMGRALEIYEGLGSLVGQANMALNLGVAKYYGGKWSEARTLWERSSDLFRTVGDLASAAAGDVLIGQVLTDQGNLDQAEPLLRGCVRMYRASADRYLLGCALTQLGRSLAREGHCEDALEVLAEAKGDLADVGASAEEIEADVAAVECYVFLGRASEALEGADAALKAIDAMGSQSVVLPQLHRARGYAFTQRGQIGEAMRAFGASLDAARERGADLDVVTTTLAMQRLKQAGLVEDVPETDGTDVAILERLGVVAVEAPPLVTAET